MPALTFADHSRVAHSVLLIAEDPEVREAAALRIAAAALCEAERDLPCGECRQCRKVMRRVHPDVSVLARELNDQGKPRQVFSVDQVRAMSEEAYILPNEADGKVFILSEAEYMNAGAQNAALKILEEPPAGVHFILCVSKPTMLLPTVRSRCVEITINGETAQKEEAAEAAEAYLSAAATGDPVKVLVNCISMEKMDHNAAVEFFGAVSSLAADVLCGRLKKPGLSDAQLLHIEELADECARYLTVNVSVKHIMGLLAVETLPRPEEEEK